MNYFFLFLALCNLVCLCLLIGPSIDRYYSGRWASRLMFIISLGVMALDLYLAFSE